MTPTNRTPELTHTVRETIEQIAEDLFILGVHHELNDIPTIDVKFDKFVDAILAAIDKDVIGEDEPEVTHEEDTRIYHKTNLYRNQLRAEQRDKLKKEGV